MPDQNTTTAPARPSTPTIEQVNETLAANRRVWCRKTLDATVWLEVLGVEPLICADDSGLDYSVLTAKHGWIIPAVVWIGPVRIEPTN